MEKVTIEGLLAKSDEELHAILGHSTQLDELKTNLEEAKALDDKAKKIFEEKLQRQFTPHVYPGEFKYMISDAKRQANPKASAKDHMNDCCCASPLD